MTLPDRWRKSSFSADQKECVEVRTQGIVGVRDTKDRDGGQLAVEQAAWAAFVAGLK